MEPDGGEDVLLERLGRIVRRGTRLTLGFVAMDAGRRVSMAWLARGVNMGSERASAEHLQRPEELIAAYQAIV